MAIEDRLRDDIRELEYDLVQLRHALHRRPEIGLDLPETQRAVLDALDGLPLEIVTGTSSSSVTAVLRGTGPTRGLSPAVLLRGDMDALPIQENTGLEFASTIDGVMHACGHDLHTTMLVGAARLLSAHRDALHGDVVFMFQPGEEGYDGAGHMLAEGVLDAAGPKVSRAFGMHVIAAHLPRGQFTSRAGTLMASSDGLAVTVNGVGGHGSAPFRAKDPVSVAAEMITALQTMVTRQFDIFDPIVITVGSFHAGTKRNIIPAQATFEATIRTFSVAARDRVAAASVRLCKAIADAHGLDATVRYDTEYPPTVNDVTQTQFALDVVTETFGADRLTPMPNPDPGAEDFSRVLEEVPGCYLFLGSSPSDDPDSVEDNHSPTADFDDSVIADGVLLHANLAIRSLQSLNAEVSTDGR